MPQSTSAPSSTRCRPSTLLRRHHATTPSPPRAPPTPPCLPLSASLLTATASELQCPVHYPSVSCRHPILHTTASVHGAPLLVPVHRSIDLVHAFFNTKINLINPYSTSFSIEAPPFLVIQPTVQSPLRSLHLGPWISKSIYRSILSPPFLLFNLSNCSKLQKLFTRALAIFPKKTLELSKILI
jgi:hypothetical protein